MMVIKENIVLDLQMAFLSGLVFYVLLGIKAELAEPYEHTHATLQHA